MTRSVLNEISQLSVLLDVKANLGPSCSTLNVPLALPLISVSTDASATQPALKPTPNEPWNPAAAPKSKPPVVCAARVDTNSYSTAISEPLSS